MKISDDTTPYFPNVTHSFLQTFRKQHPPPLAFRHYRIRQLTGIIKYSKKATEVVSRKCYMNKMFSEILQNSQEKNMRQGLFFNKIAGAGVFLRIL